MQTVAQAQPLDGPLMQRFQQLAKDTGNRLLCRRNGELRSR